MSIWEFLIGSAVLFVGSSLQATAGIGQTMVAGPVIASIEATFIPGPALLLATAPNMRNAVGDRHALDRAALRRSLWCAPLGIALGLALLAILSDRAIAIAVAAFVLLSVALQFVGRRPPDRPATDYSAGAATAFSSVAAGLPGPTYAVFYGHREPEMVRATIGRFNLAVTAGTMVVILVMGQFGWEQLRMTLLFLPATLLGLPMARVLRPRVDRNRFRILILGLATISAVAVLVRQMAFT